MTPAPTCIRCGAALPAGDPPERPCARCLLGAGLAGTGAASGAAPGAHAAGPPPDPAVIAPLFPALLVLDVIGRGGMGVVYRARQRELGRDVALKLLWTGSANDPDLAERFLREARTLARLQHPNIVTVYDSGRAGEHLYLLQELVDGTDLRRVLNSGRVEPRQALALVSAVCAALQYAHDQGVVHRDIKPENILLDRAGNVKIADFGLARVLAPDVPDGRPERLTRVGQAMGTPQYMAPEQLERPLAVDHRADIYSLGVVFYELLTGELPLGRFAPPSRKVAIDVRLDEVVLKTLEKEPEQRFQKASEVRQEVETIVSTPAPTHAAPRKSPVPLWAVIVLVALFFPMACVASCLFLGAAEVSPAEGGARPADTPR
jgi:serine/threonine protein kinase